MKRLFTLLSIAIVFLVSCSEEDNPYKSSDFTIEGSENGYTMNLYEEFTIDSKISADNDLVFEWICNGEVWSNMPTLTIKEQEKATEYTITLTVTDKANWTMKKAVMKVKVLPYRQLNLNNFELADGIETAGGKYWKNTYEDEGAHITSQIFKFSHTAMSDYKFWDGFTVSNSSDNSKQSNWIDNQWSSVAKGGYDGEGQPFVVGYAAEFMRPDKGEFSETRYTNWVKIDDNTHRYKAAGVYVSNNTWTYYCMKEGSAPARKFGQGDYLMLSAYGVTEDNTITDPVDFYLADYRSENSSEWVINDSWQWMDLSPLGEIKYIIFKLKTSDTGIYGSNTAMYFCLDKLTVEKL